MMYDAPLAQVVRQPQNGRPQKLTETEISLMVIDYNRGMSQQALADKWGVSVQTVRRYLKRRRTKK